MSSLLSNSKRWLVGASTLVALVLYLRRRDAESTAPEGDATLRFGDGRMGSPPPLGARVRAGYRVGPGRLMRAALEALAGLVSRPPGIRGVSNPVPAEGGADRETADQARSRAPTTVRALDRAVSLADFEAVALSIPGVARAAATRRVAADQTTIVVAVAGHPGQPLRAGDLSAIQRELERRRDPAVRVEVVADEGLSAAAAGR